MYILSCPLVMVLAQLADRGVRWETMKGCLCIVIPVNVSSVQPWKQLPVRKYNKYSPPKFIPALLESCTWRKPLDAFTMLQTDEPIA